MERTKCKCGCGSLANPGRKFLNGHTGGWTKGKKRTSQHPKYFSDETRAKLREKALAQVAAGKHASGWRMSEEAKNRISFTLKKKYAGGTLDHYRWWMNTRVKGWYNGYQSTFYDKNYRIALLNRDGNKCRCSTCISITKKLHRHHIDFDKSNDNPSNIIILCSSCHRIVHSHNCSRYRAEFEEIRGLDSPYSSFSLGKVFELAR